MALGSAESALTIIATCGGAGAFIDFWIGKRGDKRVRDWLETWWLRFSYVNVRNFGREEAILAVAVMDRLLRRRFFSMKRIALFIALEAVSNVIRILSGEAIPLRVLAIIFKGNYAAAAAVYAIVLATTFITFSLSIALTRLASVRAVRRMDKLPAYSGLIFVVMLLLQYPIMLIGIWLRLMYVYSLTDILLSVPDLPEHLDDVQDLVSIQWIFVNLGRLSLAALFAGSFLLKPFHRALSLVWARVVESDKPVFTLLFGGGAAAAKAIEWVIHTL